MTGKRPRLAALARKNPGGSGQTVATYSFHLAKLRWYCERVARLTPLCWSMRDVGAFLEDLPLEALCA